MCWISGNAGRLPRSLQRPKTKTQHLMNYRPNSSKSLACQSPIPTPKSLHRKQFKKGSISSDERHYSEITHTQPGGYCAIDSDRHRLRHLWASPRSSQTKRLGRCATKQVSESWNQRRSSGGTTPRLDVGILQTSIQIHSCSRTDHIRDIQPRRCSAH